MVMSMPPEETVAPSWSVRPEQPIDLDLIHELHRTAFTGPTEAELVDAIRSGPDFIPELSLVAATEDGSVLAHVLVSRVRFEVTEVEAPRVDVLALAPLAVLPPHQGRGIGTALMRAVLGAADARDEPMMIVVGSPAFYGRFGFVPANDFGISGPYDDAGDAFQVRPQPDIDAATVPAGIVEYPPAFSAV